MIICRLTDYNDELTYETLEEAKTDLEQLEETCCDDDILAETYYELKCDINEAIESGTGNFYEDDNGNLVFER